MVTIYACILASVAALAGAFVAQWFSPPQRRTKIIFTAAAAPATLLTLAVLVAGLVVGVEESWFWTAAALAFAFAALMFVGLVGAIIGSELASLARWLMRRPG